ncbi:MAG: DUF3592 domain-containing protein [Acidobacteriota bacterium]|nr:DUF3592 domain-containing protein [Acidobacteriota bacterium]
MTNIFEIAAVLIFLCGSLLLVGSPVFFLRRRAFLKKALQANGTVIGVDVRHHSGSSGLSGSINTSRSTHYYPTVRFQTADGRVSECRINISLGEPYAVGQPVIVNYDAQNPCKSMTLGDRNSQPVMPFVIFGFVGAIFAFTGLILGIISFL